MNILHLNLSRRMRSEEDTFYYLVKAEAEAGRVKPVVAALANSPLFKRLQAGNIETIALSKAGRRTPLNLLRLLWAQHRKKFAIIHTHEQRSVSLATLLCKLWGTSVCLMHSHPASCPSCMGLAKKYSYANAIATPSQNIAKNLEVHGLSAGKLHFIAPAIEVDDYPHKILRRDNRFVFVVMGDLSPKRGYFDLISAMGVLKDREMPPWEVRIIGEGPLFKDILNEAKKQGVDSHLALLGRQNVCKVLPLCDCLLVPSEDDECSASSIREAWAVGLPVICAASANSLELVEHGKNGLLFTLDENQGLANSMELLARDEAMQQRLAAAGQELLKNFTVEKMADAYAKLYNEVLSHSSAV